MTISVPLTGSVAPEATWGPPEAAAVLGSLPDPVLVIDATGAITWGNRRAEEELGIGLREARGRSIVEHLHPDDLVTVMASLSSVQAKDVGTSIQVRVRGADDAWRHYEARGWSGVHDHRIRGVVAVLRRLDDRDGWAVTAGDGRRRAAVLDHAPGLTLLLDGHTRLQGASRAFTTLLATDLESSLGRSLIDLVAPPDAPRVRAELRSALVEPGTRSFEATLRATPDGPAVPFWLTAANLLADEAVRAVVVSGLDITDLVAARTGLAHQATHDPLTNLANRGHLLEELERALQLSIGTTARVGAVYCDLDGFERVNEAHGHAVGDAVLAEVGHRLRDAVRPEDVVGRLGGDELVAVCVRDSVAEVEQAMAALVAAAEAPIATSAGPVRITLSAGCAVAHGGAHAEELLRRADANMYAARRARARR